MQADQGPVQNLLSGAAGGSRQYDRLGRRPSTGGAPDLTSEGENYDASVCNLTASVYSPSTQESPPCNAGAGVRWTDEVRQPYAQNKLAQIPQVNISQLPNRAFGQASTSSRLKQTARKYLSLSSVKDRQKRVSQFLRRAKSLMRESFRDEDSDGNTATTQKTFHRVRHVWVDVDFAPHQLQYYALLLLNFKRQLDGTQPRRLDVVEMVAYLRVAANAVELLPDTILEQLTLDSSVDIQSLNETFTDMLNCSAIVPTQATAFPSRWKRHTSPSVPASTNQETDAQDRCTPHYFLCEICGDARADTRVQPCGHVYHHGCLTDRWSASEVSSGLCPRCGISIQSIQEASVLEVAVRQIGSGRGIKLNKNRPWVLSYKFQKLLDCVEFEMAKAAREKSVVRFVVVADYKAMVEGFSRTLATFGKIQYDVIFSGINKFRIPSMLLKYGASIEPRLLLYHSSAVSPKHDLSSTTHVYFLTPWRDQEVRRTILNCVLRDTIAGAPVLVADFVSTDSIEAEVLQVNSSESADDDESLCGTNLVLSSSNYSSEVAPGSGAFLS